jgi:hypothetical protein
VNKGYLKMPVFVKLEAAQLNESNDVDWSSGGLENTRQRPTAANGSRGHADDAALSQTPPDAA